MKVRTIIAAAAALTAGGLGVRAGLRAHAVNESTGKGQRALITGASGGIGKEFAEIFADKGYDLVLVARSEDNLKNEAGKIRTYYNVDVKIIPMDLSVKGAAQDLFDAVCDMDLTIDVLVNNAGAGMPGDTVKQTPEQLEKLIGLDITSLTELCALFGKAMADRNHGRILNVASMASVFAMPGINIYSGAKAYVLQFSRTLRQELKDSGVSVTVLCPGPANTDWASRAGLSSEMFTKSPFDVAMTGYKALVLGDSAATYSPYTLYKKVHDLIPEDIRGYFESQIMKGMAGQ